MNKATPNDPDTGKTTAKTDRNKEKKTKKLETEAPLAEKDEVKKAEDELRERMKRKISL